MDVSRDLPFTLRASPHILKLTSPSEWVEHARLSEETPTQPCIDAKYLISTQRVLAGVVWLT